ncbi:MAG: PAS domain S-box protein [Nitrospirota bacterium]
MSKKGRVLVVDDEIDVLNSLCDILSELGHDTEGFTSSKEAIEALNNRYFDILLTDLTMPEMTGIELLKITLKIDPLLVCILMTGKGTIETAVEAMKIGAFDYILKPFKLGTLSLALSRAIEVRRLRMAEEKYRSIIEGQAELICRFLPNKKLTFVNDAFCRYFGKEHKKLIGHNLISLIPKEAEEIINKHLSYLNQKNPFVVYEHRVLLNGGKTGWLQWISGATFDEKGEVVEFQSVGRDISRQKQAEESLLLLKKAIEALPIGITISDTEQKIVYVNPADAQIHGYTVDELIGKNAQIYAPLDAWKPLSFEQIHQMGVWRRESVNIRRTGDIFPVQLTSIAVKDDHGIPLGIVICCEDITTYKKMESQLRASEKMKALGQLAVGVAHEVRNPLNAILVVTEAFFKEIGENPKYQPYLLHIRSQVERLSALMKDLLELGKPIERSSFKKESLSDICHSSINIWKDSKISQKYKVSWDSDGSDIFVFANSQKLQQVVLNLLENAVHHSPDGSEIKVAIKQLDGDMCSLQIIDQGSGIPDKIFPRIFEPFFSTRRGGTGLGLSIIKHIVETHGGNVVLINNEPPPGCIAEIRLPIYKKK